MIINFYSFSNNQSSRQWFGDRLCFIKARTCARTPSFSGCPRQERIQREKVRVKKYIFIPPRISSILFKTHTIFNTIFGSGPLPYHPGSGAGPGSVTTRTTAKDARYPSSVGVRLLQRQINNPELAAAMTVERQCWMGKPVLEIACHQ